MGGRDYVELCIGEQCICVWIQLVGGQIGCYWWNEEVSELVEVVVQDDYMGIEYVDDYVEVFGQVGSQVIEGIEDLLVFMGCMILNLDE